MNIAKAPALATVIVAVSGCSDTPRLDADYGSSVRQMVQAQTFDPIAASHPAEFAPDITDGTRLQNALDIYRKDVAKGSTEVKRPIVFEVGE